jgi:SAM-dependent methyltransferase
MTDDPLARTPYVDTFFKELSPTWLNYVVALHGVAPCRLDRPFAYAELGCGFGQTVVTNAAAFPHANFVACDFNPQHVDAARRYAAALGVRNLDVWPTSFEEIARRELPSFDFVVLHGVYSWIGEAAKRAVMTFIRRNLKPGGIAYVSYNSLPGWADEMPLRRLFRELANGDAVGVGDALARGLRSLDQLADTKLGYFTAHPAMRDVAKSLAKRAPGYLAHEYLGQRWAASYCVDVADEMREADLHYLGSATLTDNHPALTTADETASAIAALSTARQRRLADDFATNRSFRRDVFVRGAVASTTASHLEGVVVGRLRSAESLPLQARVPRGIVTFQEPFVAELRELLAPGTLTVRDICDRLHGRASNANEIVRNLTILLAAGELWPFAYARTYGDAADGRADVDTATRAALAYAVEQRTPRALPSCILGNGVEVGPLDALALMEWLVEPGDTAELAHRVADRIGREDWVAPAAATDVAAAASSAATNAIDTLFPTLRRLGLLAAV